MIQYFLSASLTIAFISLGNLSARAENSNSLPVPDPLKVPSGQILLFKAAAKGVQIYSCQAKAESTTDFEWTLKAPKADLFNNRGVLLGKHYGGPTWELSADGSKVVGAVAAKVNAPQTGAIPLLLLQAKSYQGTGLLTSVNWIQRLDTLGGKAPATGCDRSRQQAEVRVPYTANYYFYRAANP